MIYILLNIVPFTQRPLTLFSKEVNCYRLNGQGSITDSGGRGNIFPHHLFLCIFNDFVSLLRFVTKDKWLDYYK
jgi:hypothetical protein